MNTLMLCLKVYAVCSMAFTTMVGIVCIVHYLSTRERYSTWKP